MRSAKYQSPSIIGKTLEGKNPQKLICLQNGILDIDTMELIKHSEQFFTLNCLDLEY